MPYVTADTRMKLLSGKPAEGPGELNYIFSILIRDYFNSKPSYQSINDIVGALEGAKIEFYRRVASKYEDQKREENGEVYF
jgi:hypothetical protein